MASCSVLHFSSQFKSAHDPKQIVRLARNTSIRRVFDNSQLIDKFDKWLQICGKAANTRTAYKFTAESLAKFIEKPLTAATKEDVRDFIGSLYTKGLAATTLQARLDALRVLFDCLQLGSRVRV